MLRTMAATIAVIFRQNQIKSLSPILSNVMQFSSSSRCNASKNYKLVIVGGGTGGSAVANKFASKLGVGNVAVVEPSNTHYYQPMFTLVGAGIKTLQDASRTTKSILPKKADWIQDRVAAFDPDNNTVSLENGDQLHYEYLVIALGIQMNFNKIKGLENALKVDPMVVSNYKDMYVTKTFSAIQNFKEGNAVFTFPNTPIKCAGAPQKIMYLSDYHFRQMGKRDKAKIIYNTSLPVIFGVKKYADALLDVVADRQIDVNFRKCLVEVKPETKEAIFQNLDSETGETETLKYEMLHAVPPMSCPDVLKKSTKLIDETGWVNVNKNTLQHQTFSNIFALGDCTNMPTSKTAAAISAQAGVLSKNLKAKMAGKELKPLYDGYTSCPLITSKGKCIMAEFGFDGPLETFPINQAKERRTMYHLKKDFMPSLYWFGLVKGLWNGPTIWRKLMHLGFSK